MTITNEPESAWVKDQQGESIWTLGCLMTFKATAKTTGGRLTVIDEVLARSTTPPVHFHRNEDEAWYVLEGEITFQVGDSTYDTGPGDFVFAPRGTPHTFAARSDQARMLIIYTPGGFEQYFQAVGEPAAALEAPPEDGPPTAEQIAELDRLALEYGCEVTGPPLMSSRQGPPM